MSQSDVIQVVLLRQMSRRASLIAQRCYPLMAKVVLGAKSVVIGVGRRPNAWICCQSNRSKIRSNNGEISARIKILDGCRDGRVAGEGMHIRRKRIFINNVAVSSS